MDELLAMLRSMRGETSEPLISELTTALDHAEKNRNSIMTIQVDSTLVAKGLSLIVNFGQTVVARIYVARREIPGFLPFDSTDLLMAIGWKVGSDSYAYEFSLVWKSYPSFEIAQVAEDLARALEALGAPQKHHWKLAVNYV